MPKNEEIIIDARVILDDDTMPCGCPYEDAFMEAWLVSIGGWTERQPASTRIKVSFFLFKSIRC